MKRVYVGTPIEKHQQKYKITMSYEDSVKVGTNSFPKEQAEEIVENLRKVFKDLTIDLVEVEQ